MRVHRDLLNRYKRHEIKTAKGVDVKDLLKPITKKLRGQEILLISPGIQLISTYRDLYSPSTAICNSFDDVLLAEKRLFGYMTSRITEIIGGQKSNIRSKVKKIVLGFIALNKHMVLIGEEAASYMVDHEVIDNLIEVISERPALELVNVIRAEGISATYSRKELFVISDFRLTRTTIKIDDGKDVVYVYNSAKYDLIPFNEISGGLRIGSPFVVMRFLLINIWIIRWIMSTGKINEDFALQKIERLLRLVITIRTNMLPEGALLDKAEIDDKYISTTESLSVFQKNRFIGIYIDDTIAIKTRTGKSYQDYFPQMYKNQFGYLRSI